MMQFLGRDITRLKGNLRIKRSIRKGSVSNIIIGTINSKSYD